MMRTTDMRPSATKPALLALAAYMVMVALSCGTAALAQSVSPGGGGGGAGAGDVVGPSSATDLRVIVFDGATGKLIKETACSIDANGKITCPGGVAAGDGTASSGLVLPELTANGTDRFYLVGAASQAAVGCAVVSGQPADNQILKGTASTVSITLESVSRTCRVMAWEADAGGSATSTHYKDWLFLRRDATAGTSAIVSHLNSTASSISAGGTDYHHAGAQFDGTTSEWATLQMMLPATWTGTLDFYWTWGYSGSSTAGDKVRFLFKFGCYSPADDITAAPVATVDKSVTKTIANIGYRDVNRESHLAVDISATCSPEDHMVLQYGRDPAHADDNRTSSVLVPMLAMKYETTP